MKQGIVKQLAKTRLWERRKTLEDSIPISVWERRIEDRLDAPEPLMSSISRNGVLLNLSESGFAVQMPERCRFARGESHRLHLKVGPGSVEVDGKVCWTRSDWAESEYSERRRYRQVAGFEILDSVPEEARSILGIMRGLVKNSGVAVEVSGSHLLDRISQSSLGSR